MNVEQRRAYYEKVRQMDGDSLMKESRRVKVGVDSTIYGTLGAIFGVTTLAAAAAVTNNSADLKLLIPAVILTGVAAAAGKFSGDFMQKSNTVHLERARRGWGLDLSSFQRWGISYIRRINSRD